MAVSLIALLLSTPLIPKTGQSKYSYILIYFFAISLGALHRVKNGVFPILIRDVLTAPRWMSIWVVGI